MLHQQERIRERRAIVPHGLHPLVPQLPLPGKRVGVRDDLVPSVVKNGAAAGRARWQWLVSDRRRGQQRHEHFGGRSALFWRREVQRGKRKGGQNDGYLARRCRPLELPRSAR